VSLANAHFKVALTALLAFQLAFLALHSQTPASIAVVILTLVATLTVLLLSILNYQRSPRPRPLSASISRHPSYLVSTSADNMGSSLGRPVTSHRHSRIGFHPGGARARIKRGEEETCHVRDLQQQKCKSRAEQWLLGEDLLFMVGSNPVFRVFQSHISQRLA
jgi:hypothetical protein